MKKLVMAILFVSFATFSFANQMNTGCGLGTIVIKQANSTILQVLVTCLNHTSGTQTFGITTGTSNCRSGSFAVNDNVQLFVENNMDNLMTDVAQGKGETIDALASMMEVKDTDAFAEKLHTNFAAIFPSSDVEAGHVALAVTELSRS